MKRKTDMMAQLARMTQMLIMSPSTSNIETTTELYQGIMSRMARRRCQVVEEVLVAKAAHKRGEEGKADARKQKGPHAVTSEHRTLGSQILHSKTRRVKLHITGIVICKMTN